MSADLRRWTVLLEVFPEDKYKLVEALQKSKRSYCGNETGDGVNDAPAQSRPILVLLCSGASDAAGLLQILSC